MTNLNQNQLYSLVYVEGYVKKKRNRPNKRRKKNFSIFNFCTTIKFKLLFIMLRPIASRLSNTVSTVSGAVLKRNASVIVGPATKTIPTVEKYSLATLMMVGFLAYPVYILSNIKNYKANKE